MKPEAQRIAIAEACGWTEVALDYAGTGRYLFGHKPGTVKPEERHVDFPGLRMTLGRVARSVVPDYPSDLNAMHEAEKALKERGNIEDRRGGICASERTLFVIELMGVLSGGVMNNWPQFGPPAGFVFDVSHATAAQRAEAFLRTLNLWTDSK